jgi:hypothetical protein
MYARLALKNDIFDIVEIINSYETMYGIDLTTSGLRDKHIKLINDYIPNTETAQVMVVVNEEEHVLGFCFQGFVDKSWLLAFCYIRQLANKNQFNASKIGGLLLDKLCESAEEREIYKFYYAVRDSDSKRLSFTLSVTKMVNHRYGFVDIEKIPVMTKTTNALIEKYILGLSNGLNKKPIIIRHGYLK